MGIKAHDYVHWHTVVRLRMPWKKDMYHSYILSRDGPKYELGHWDSAYSNRYNRYITICLNRLNLGAVRGLPKVNKLMELSAHVRTEPGGSA